MQNNNSKSVIEKLSELKKEFSTKKNDDEQIEMTDLLTETLREDVIQGIKNVNRNKKNTKKKEENEEKKKSSSCCFGNSEYDEFGESRFEKFIVIFLMNYGLSIPITICFIACSVVFGIASIVSGGSLFNLFSYGPYILSLFLVVFFYYGGNILPYPFNDNFSENEYHYFDEETPNNWRDVLHFYLSALAIGPFCIVILIFFNISNEKFYQLLLLLVGNISFIISSLLLMLIIFPPEHIYIKIQEEKEKMKY